MRTELQSHLKRRNTLEYIEDASFEDIEMEIQKRVELALNSEIVQEVVSLSHTHMCIMSHH